MQTLKGKVAVVAGATRGAGRGIACALGEAGATVYCTGRSVRGKPSSINRPETIEETAEMATARGGVGVWAQIDHTKPEQVRMLFERVKQEQGGRLDVLVNNISGDEYIGWESLCTGIREPFWEFSIERGLMAQCNGVHSHIITSHSAAAIMVQKRQGLIVEINDGNHVGYNPAGVFYSFSKASVVLLAHLMAEELREHNVAAVSLTPGFLRSEKMLDTLGVSEANWRDGIEKRQDFANSETPFYIGRAVVALATDPNVMNKTGHALSAGYLAREYGFTDIDGTQPPGYCREGVFRGGEFVHMEDE